MEEKQVNGSEWRYSRIKTLNVKLSDLDIIGGTSYLELPINHRLIRNVKNTTDNYSAPWFILAPFYHPKANTNLTTSYVQHFCTINKYGKNFDKGLQYKGIPNIEKLKKFTIHLFEVDETELERSKKPYFPPIYKLKNEIVPKEKIVVLLFFINHFCLFESFYPFIRKEDKKNCRNCLTTFSREVLQKTHKKYFQKIGLV